MDTGNFMTRIEEGMKVFDRLHHEIGKVDYVKMSDDDPETPEIEAATPDRLDERSPSLLDSIAEVFSTDGLDDELRDRLLQQGFVRIDSNGLFAADRYVTPDQIMSVSGDAVTLKVSKDELLKKH